MSDLLARLIDAGTPSHLVAEVARELARAEVAQEAIRQRREAEAARTERYRERGGGDIDADVRHFVMERDDYACRDCGAEDNLCCDHIIPVSKGGTSEAENLQVLCKPCNSRKKDRIRKRDERRLSENVQGRARTGRMSKDRADKTEASYVVPPVSLRDTAPQGTKRNRGTKIPADWKPPKPSELSPEARRLAEQWPEASYRAEAEAFVNYWLGEAGVKATKANWTTAWANRIVQIHAKVMREAAFASNRPASRDPPSYLDHALAKAASR